MKRKTIQLVWKILVGFIAFSTIFFLLAPFAQQL
jgi:hypothetical protein